MFDILLLVQQMLYCTIRFSIFGGVLKFLKETNSLLKHTSFSVNKAGFRRLIGFVKGMGASLGEDEVLKLCLCPDR